MVKVADEKMLSGLTKDLKKRYVPGRAGGPQTLCAQPAVLTLVAAFLFLLCAVK